MEIQSINSKLNSNSSNEMYDALIDIGKNHLYDFEKRVYELLEHEDPEVRRASVMVLGTYWSRQSFIGSVKDIWKNDADDLVQITALISWFSFYFNTRDSEVVQQLYDVLKNDDYDTDMRKEALRGMYLVQGVDVPNKLIDQLDFVWDANEFNELVNWEEVNALIE